MENQTQKVLTLGEFMYLPMQQMYISPPELWELYGKLNLFQQEMLLKKEFTQVDTIIWQKITHYIIHLEDVMEKKWFIDTDNNKNCTKFTIRVDDAWFLAEWLGDDEIRTMNMEIIYSRCMDIIRPYSNLDTYLKPLFKPQIRVPPQRLVTIPQAIGGALVKKEQALLPA